MCVLALLVDRYPGFPLIVAANRDEAYARKSLPPKELENGILGGQDAVHGGTWLGVSRSGLFAAVTNRETPPSRPDGLSRGRLTLESLRCRTLT